MAYSNRRNRGQTIRRSQGDAPKAPAQPTGTQVELSCGHSLFYNPPVPKIGDDIYCRTGCGTVAVVDIKAEWRTKCTECRYSRSWGQAELTARTKASAHALRNNHTVSVLLGNDVQNLVNEHPTEDLLDTDPPF